MGLRSLSTWEAELKTEVSLYSKKDCSYGSFHVVAGLQDLMRRILLWYIISLLARACYFGYHILVTNPIERPHVIILNFMPLSRKYPMDL